MISVVPSKGLKIKKLDETLLAPDEPAPFIILNPDAVVPVLLVCDHASHRFPRSLGTMGLDYLNRHSHVVHDIGAGALVEMLANTLGVTAVLCQYSRLIVDCNRELVDHNAFLKFNDGVDIPANHNLRSDEKEKRASEIYWPYHNAIEGQIGRLKDQGINPVFISVHSFSPVINGEARKWEIGVLWDKDSTTAEFFLSNLGEAGYFVGDNKPYSGKDPEDFTIDHHAEPSGLPHVGIEIRQDLIHHSDGIKRISGILQKTINLVAMQDRPIDIETQKSFK
tara:strand:+ start:1281 stop:2120 length:840 start_codon:yes stop_codon:yes gene_type:complete